MADFPRCSGWVRIFATTLLLLGSEASAKLLHIIHTNDLHAYFDPAPAGTTERAPGYLAIKSAIDSFRAQAATEGAETLVMDAGDFSDGTIYRYGQHGTSPLRALDEMGYDVATIGNHDWLIGTDQLDAVFDAVRPRLPFVVANFTVGEKQKALRSFLHPYVLFQKAGVKIAVVGLTTDELIYRWLADRGRVTDPQETAGQLITYLDRNADFVFVLSHMGFKADVELAKNLPGIDLIVGGHSHTELLEPFLVQSPDKRKVPILQAGSHGEWVGSLPVDLVRGKPLRLGRYKIEAPVPEQNRGDTRLGRVLEDARLSLSHYYGPGWLEEEVATSAVVLERPLYGKTIWGDIHAEVLRRTAKTEAALDIAAFYGSPQPAGPVTRETLFNFYPRTFDMGRPHGWNVWKIKIPGWALKYTLKKAIKANAFLNTVGITYKLKWKDGKPELENLRVGGRKVKTFKVYELAVPEGVGRGATDMSALLNKIFKPKDTGIPMWLAVEDMIRGLRQPIGATWRDGN